METAQSVSSGSSLLEKLGQLPEFLFCELPRAEQLILSKIGAYLVQTLLRKE